MTLRSTTAFVLRVDPISEKDVAVSFLTPDLGVVRGVVAGGRGKGRKGALLQLLTEVSVTFFVREGRDLARADSLEMKASAFALATRAETAMLLPYLAESLSTFLPEADAAPETYRLVRHVLDALGEGVPADLAARYFEVWLLLLAGLLADPGTCAGCGRALAGEAVRLDPEEGAFVGPECGGRGGLPLSPATLALLARLRRSPLGALAAARVAEPDDLRALETLAREIRRRFLGHELKSYRFLEALGPA